MEIRDGNVKTMNNIQDNFFLKGLNRDMNVQAVTQDNFHAKSEGLGSAIAANASKGS